MRKVQKIAIKSAKVADIVLTVMFALIAPLLLFSMWWMFRTWDNLSMDELMFHLNSPLEGTNTDMVREYIAECLLPAILILLVVVLLLVVFRKKRWFYLMDAILLVLGIVVSFGTVYVTAERLNLEEYLENQGTASDFIDTYYVDPAETSITFPEEKRNLIYIFLESMETTYADESSGGGFSVNVIPELTEIAQENEDFSGENEKINGAHAMTGASWTMGAMFAQTSGLPLNISINGNDMDTQEHFFPGIVTLGDILESEGYSQTLLVGSDATFGGRRLYFTEHGNYDIIDHPYATQNGMLPEDYSVWWGYEDYHLFDFAKEKLQELSSQDNPFNLTMLTVDTHFEDGYVCEKCEDTYGDHQYANVMACSSKQLAEFISWIQEQDFYQNTTIVLAGDHLTMDSDFCEDVSADYDRRTYVAYINSAAEREVMVERTYSTMDHFPTTLAAMGAEIEGDRLGLGRNLFSAEQTLVEYFGVDEMNQELQRKSELMEELASIDRDSEALKIREENISKAIVEVGDYQSDTGMLSVKVSDIENVENGIQSVLIAVWTTEDQSDLQWIQMEADEDRNYHADVDVEGFEDKGREYQIHAYVVDGNGEQNIIGNTSWQMDEM
nr:GBS Bsp-like repeat-containing protein [uncultured Merdimonas sp.]